MNIHIYLSSGKAPHASEIYLPFLDHSDYSFDKLFTCQSIIEHFLHLGSRTGHNMILLSPLLNIVEIILA